MTIGKDFLGKLGHWFWHSGRLRPVCPDDGIKSGPISPKNSPKSSHTLFTIIVTLLEIAQKVATHFLQ